MLRLVRQAGIHEDRRQPADRRQLLSTCRTTIPAAFDRQPLRAYNVAPNALLMNFKVVRYWFEPDYDSANAVRVWVDPPLENLRVENRLALGRGYCGGYQRGITITAERSHRQDDLQRPFSERLQELCDGSNRTQPQRIRLRPVHVRVARVGRRVSVEGSWMNARCTRRMPSRSSRFRSLPLTEIISRVNKNSNNVMARQILYTLSAEELGPPGTEEGRPTGRRRMAAGHGHRFPDTDTRQRCGIVSRSAG